MANVALVLTICEGLHEDSNSLEQGRGPLLCPHIPGNRTGHRPRDNQTTNPETTYIQELQNLLATLVGRKSGVKRDLESLVGK